MPETEAAMSEVKMKCPVCKVEEPKLIGTGKQIRVGNQARDVSIILCGECGTILSVFEKP